MKILLIDIHQDGHHLEYASNLHRGLSDALPHSEVDFLTLSHNELLYEYFNIEDVTCIYDYDFSNRMQTESIIDEVYRTFYQPRNNYISKCMDYADGYDIVHFLHVDDIIGELYTHGDRTEATVLGSLNGGFFRNLNPIGIRIANSLINSRIGCLISPIIPNILSRREPWNIINLHLLLQETIVEEAFINSKPGKELLESFSWGGKFEFPLIPDPVKPWFRSKIEQESARRELGLPLNKPIFTFFGEIRQEKGVDILLKALQQYDGPSIACVIAGSPIDMDESDIESIESETVSFHTDLKYIPQKHIRLYYAASDYMVFPYRPSFGRYRRSGTFQKACSAGRPVIAADFGRFADLIPEWNLGLTFEPGSSEDLAKKIREVVCNEQDVFDRATMRQYAEKHTYSNLIDKTVSVYERMA